MVINLGFTITRLHSSEDSTSTCIGQLGDNLSGFEDPAVVRIRCHAILADKALVTSSRISFVAPPTAWLHSTHISTTFNNRTLLFSPHYEYGAGRNSRPVVVSLLGNDTIEIPSSLLPWSDFRSVPGLPGGLKLLMTGIWNATLHRIRPPSSLSGTELPLEKKYSQSGRETLAFPPAHALRKLCEPRQTEFPTCLLQFTWTLRYLVAEDTAQLETRRLEEAIPLFHTQICPPNCLGDAVGGVIAFVETCAGYHFGPECFDPVTAASAFCAFGAPPACSPCPSNAACPGGQRAWPGIGYWTPFEASGVIHRCAPPAADRCPGWSPIGNASTCGPGFDPLAPLCGACLPNYFFLDGVCVSCEPTYSIGGAGGAYLACVLVALALLYLAVAGLVSHGIRFSGLPVAWPIGFRIAADVLLCFVAELQVLLQLSRVSFPGVPSWLRRVFSLFQALEGDINGILPAACGRSSRFMYMTVMSILGLVCFAIILVTAVYHLKRSDGSTVVMGSPRTVRKISGTSGWARSNSIIRQCLSWLQICSSSALLLLYGPILRQALVTLNCSHISDLTLTENGTRLATSYLWFHDTRVHCSEGDHAAATALAWSSLLIIGIGLPMFFVIATTAHAKQAIGGFILSQEQREGRSKVPCGCKLPQPISGLFSQCRCIIFRAFPKDARLALNLHHAWLPVYSYGQPWARPILLCTTFAVSLPAFLLQDEEVLMFRSIFLIGTVVGFCVFWCWPTLPVDHEWSLWKKWPRRVTFFGSISLVSLHFALALSGYQATVVSSILSSLAAASLFSQPIVLILSLSFSLWGTIPRQERLSCRRFKKGRNRRAVALLDYVLTFEPKQTVQNLILRRRKSNVVQAMLSPTPRSSMRALLAQGKKSFFGVLSASEPTAPISTEVHANSVDDAHSDTLAENLGGRNLSLSMGEAHTPDDGSCVGIDWTSVQSNPLHLHVGRRHLTSPEGVDGKVARGSSDFSGPSLHGAISWTGVRTNPLFLVARTDDRNLGWEAAISNPLFSKEAARARGSRNGSHKGHHHLPASPLPDPVTQPSMALDAEDTNSPAEIRSPSSSHQIGSPAGDYRRKFSLRRLGKRSVLKRQLRDGESLYGELVKREVGNRIASSLKSYASDLAYVSNRVSQKVATPPSV